MRRGLGFLVVGGAFNTGGPWGKLQPGVEEKVKQAPEMLSNCRQGNIWVKALSDASLGEGVGGGNVMWEEIPERNRQILQMRK